MPCSVCRREPSEDGYQRSYMATKYRPEYDNLALQVSLLYRPEYDNLELQVSLLYRPEYDNLELEVSLVYRPEYDNLALQVSLVYRPEYDNLVLQVSKSGVQTRVQQSGIAGKSSVLILYIYNVMNDYYIVRSIN